MNIVVREVYIENSFYAFASLNLSGDAILQANA